jgi:hypothetical protein
VGKEVKMLEYHSYLAAVKRQVELFAVIAFLFGYIDALKDDLSGCGYLKKVEGTEKC